MGFGVDIRVDAQADRRGHAHFSGNPAQQFQFWRGFNVEAQNTGLQCLAHLGGGLADAGKHHFARIASGCDDTRQFAARYDVKTAAQARKNVEYAEVGIGFYRITQQMIASGEGGVEVAPGPGQLCARIDITGGAEFSGDARQRYGFSIELAITIMERPHGVAEGSVAGAGAGTGAGGAGAGFLTAVGLSLGKYSGPL